MNSKFQNLTKTLILFSAFALLHSVQSSGKKIPDHKLKVVAVLDTGLDLTDPRFQSILCKSGHIDLTGKGIQDDHGHGTHVLGSIKRNAPEKGWCAVIIKNSNGKAEKTDRIHNAGFMYLVRLKPDYVNYSGGGERPYEIERKVISFLKKTKFIVAAGNNGQNLASSNYSYYPAKYDYPNITPVGSVDVRGIRVPSSNYGLPYVRWELGEEVLSTLPNGLNGIMSGTSMATSIATGKIIRDDLERKK